MPVPPSSGPRIVDLGCIDEFGPLDPEFMERNSAEIDEVQGPLQKEHGVHLTVEDAEGKLFDPGL
jgi:hypothetical protein